MQLQYKEHHLYQQSYLPPQYFLSGGFNIWTQVYQPSTAFFSFYAIQ